MEKPEGWEGAELIKREYNKPSPGPFILMITRAYMKTVVSGKILALDLDIADGPFTAYFTELFAKTGYHILDHHQCTKGKSLPYFKTLIADIEASNKGYSFERNNFNEVSLGGKLIGANLRYEEYMARGKVIKTRLKPAYFCSVGKIMDDNHQIWSTKPLSAGSY